ncbi:TetR/AcrR family transcriptional regulator [Amycolatopsis taiwanensis]|uniref:Transcriptional regulator TetR family protein n=1 Tax=Amycolatopsis taiwanensis TaxID=342230 RepID=A0A9W6R841_9PSEU|nr:TetR/AcrR family transcriptional regulator [Amycolatopsis taiwanensis]GLY71013.1 putative transcriptional regulator TetR family protein [Amycolatopsis taiwanensis]
MAEPQDRRNLIISCAAELFARKGVGATTVREIADAVGILSGSLYHHFESKDAIVDEVLGYYLDNIKKRYAEVMAGEKSPAERLHELVYASLVVAEECPHATVIYQNELHYLREQPRFRHVQLAAADIQQTWLQVINEGVRDGSFRDNIEPRVFYRSIRDAVWLSTRWHRPKGPNPTERLAEDVTSIFLDGFSAKPRPAIPPAARRHRDRSATGC